MPRACATSNCMRQVRTHRNSSRLARPVGLGALALALVALLATMAPARMSSQRVDRHLCETRGGGKFVDIPGFPGERIDRRLRRDIRWIDRRYDIFVTDGFAMEGHARNGEHPLGLALDIVPDKASGGSWAKIDKLAHWAEPRQDDPRPPFRWVGYDGDAGHGRGHHLHLSWMHSESPPGDPAPLVYTRRCPGRKGGGDGGRTGSGDGGDSEGGSGADEPSTGDEGGDRDGSGSDAPPRDGEGGIDAGDDDGFDGDGGIGARRVRRARDGGVEARRLKRRIARLQAAGPERD